MTDAPVRIRTEANRGAGPTVILADGHTEVATASMPYVIPRALIAAEFGPGAP